MWNKKKAEETFCPLPWNHLATRSTYQLHLCCNAVYDESSLLRHKNKKPLYLYELKDISFLDNNSTLNTVRKQMLSGQKPAQCYHCFKEDSMGIQSPRKTYQNFYPILDKALKTTRIDGSTKHQAQYIDLRLENLCNLRCRMCGPEASRKLVKEHLTLGAITKKMAKDLTKNRSHENLLAFFDKNLNHVDLIYIAGGKPTLTTVHLNLLTKCIEKGLAKNISLKYSTNMTNISSNFFDYWKEFKQVKLLCSVDGFEKINGYIRNPSDWSTIDTNLKKIEKYMDRYLVSGEDDILYKCEPTKEELWDKYYIQAPAQLRQPVEKYKIVKRA